MTNYATRGLKIGATIADATLAQVNLDALLTGAAGGVRTLFDLDFSWCYPGGAFETRAAAGAPGAGQTVYDMTRRSNLQARVPGSGSGPTYGGGGFDLSPLTTSDGGVRGPADTWATIVASQYYLWTGYFRLPTSSDFYTGGSYMGMFASGAAVGGFQSEADPITIAQVSGNLAAARQTAVNAFTSLSVTPTADHFGKVCQLAFWRNAAGIGFRVAPLVPATGTTIDLSKALTATGAVGALNTADFSGKAPQWGVPIPFVGAPMNAAQQNGTNIRLYRGWIEDLSVSNRDPLTVLNADLQRVLDRYIASAAANAGASLIFV